MRKKPKMMEEQYRQLREDWRHYDKLIWAAPSIVITITGILIGIAYKIENLGIRLALLGMASVWIFTLLVSIVKHRLFQEARTSVIYEIEKPSGKFCTPIETDDAINKLKRERKLKQKPETRHFEGCPGYKLLRGSIILMFAITLSLFAHTLYSITSIFVGVGAWIVGIFGAYVYGRPKTKLKGET